MLRATPIIASLAAWLSIAACSQLQEATEPTPSEEELDAATIGLAPRANWGPYQTIEEVCASVRNHREGRCVDMEGYSLIDPDPPYRAVRVVHIGKPSLGLEYCELAIEIERGWYLSEDLFLCDEAGAKFDAEVINLELVMQKKGPPVVRAEVKTRSESDGALHTSEELAICGVGDSGDVSCTESFSRYEHLMRPDGEQEHRSASLTLSRFGVIKLRGDAFVEGELVDATGAYRLEFP